MLVEKYNPNSLSVSAILGLIASGDIAIPEIQRPFVWKKKQVGGIEIEQGHSLDEQIAANEQKAKLEKEISRLERQARNEKQPKKKFELAEQVKKLKKQLNIHF